MKDLRLTTSMQFVLHSLLSLVIGAVISGLTVLGQGIFQTGANPQVVIGAGVAAFVAWFTHGFIALINNPQTFQAGSDTVKALEGKIATLEASHSVLQSVVNTIVQAAQTPAPTVTTTPTQLPFPAQTPIPYQPQAWTSPQMAAVPPQPPKG